MFPFVTLLQMPVGLCRAAGTQSSQHTSSASGASWLWGSQGSLARWSWLAAPALCSTTMLAPAAAALAAQ